MTDHRDSRSNDRRPSGAGGVALRAQSELVEDRLVRLLGRRTLPDLDPESPIGERFFDWWARDLRARESSAGEFEARAVAFEARVRARIAEIRYGVRVMNERPGQRPPPVDGPVAQVLDRASAERCAPAFDLRVAAGVGRDLWDEPCTSWIELPEDVRNGQHIALTVAGESMEPLLHDGDTILLRLGPPIERDTVVVARHPDDGFVVKRVARVGARVVELASLHPGFAPIRIPRRDDLILGTVLLCWRRERS
jgi:SOS-response transcriptional repressor LexA